MTEDHVRILARSPGVKNLRILDLSSNWDFQRKAARILFSSEHLRSLVHLALDGTQEEAEVAEALAAAKGWERLRSLRLQVTNAGLRRLLASPNVSRLVWLSLEGHYREGSSSLTIKPKWADELTRLPHLACLSLTVSTCDARVRRRFSASGSLPWVLICSDDVGNDEKMFRGSRAPDQWPPVDDTWELGFRWQR